MNGYHHRKLLYLTFIPAAFIILYLQFTNIIQLNLLFNGYFTVLWAVGTWIWTPDKDLELPFFNHRGITHSFPLWFSVGVFGYFYFGWYFVAFPVTQLIHIVSDWCSTGVKRRVNKVKGVF